MPPVERFFNSIEPETQSWNLPKACSHQKSDKKPITHLRSEASRSFAAAEGTRSQTGASARFYRHSMAVLSLAPTGACNIQNPGEQETWPQKTHNGKAHSACGGRFESHDC